MNIDSRMAEALDDLKSAIVVNELKKVYGYCKEPLTQHPEDAIMNYKVREGIKPILEYYLSHDEYIKWLEGENNEELRSETCEEVQRCCGSCR